MPKCASCGFENAETAKFCSECGVSLAPASTARAEERKVVSVVFVDLVGSTARAETSDPEDVRALLRVYHEQARDELEKFGGTVEKFIGDAVVAVFGAPLAHEDDPERAVRAALAVRTAVARMNDEKPGRDLHVRIAVNTGEALVSLEASSREGEAMVAGDVMNTAARLQSAAPVDGILVCELGQVVDEDEELITWRQGRSLPYGEGVSYWALGEIVKAHAGILESDPADDTELKLTAATAVVADESERSWVERHLRPLVGLGGDEVTTGDRRGEAFAAWRRFLEAIAEAGPTVLVFEDLHWADDGLLDFVDNLVDWVDGVSLLVVCTARPELLERRRGWGGGKRNASTVSLAPLDGETTANLVRALLDKPLLDAELQEALVDRAGGNPLYAEEFVRMIEAGGSVEGGLPESVHGIVAARIDLLPAAEKALVQSAAVLGQVFWSDALIALSGSEEWQLAETLRSLERKEFIRREQRSAVSGASQHAFVHALVRDTTYGQLPRGVRSRLHVAAAEWIESLPEDRAEDRAETVAHHYLTAIELRRAAGEDVGELGARAVGALQEAGERALALAAFDTAVRLLSEALDLLPQGVEPSPELLLAAGKAFGFVGRAGDELARAVEAYERAGDPERAAECAVMAAWHTWHADPGVGQTWLERAAGYVEDRPASRAKALVLAEQARRAMIDYQKETGLELADRAVALAAEVGDTEIRADALVTKGAILSTAGDPTGVELMEEALLLVGHRGRVATRAHTNLSVAWLSLGDLRRVTDALEQGIARAEKEGDVQGLWFLRGNLFATSYAIGDWDGALAMAQSFADSPDSGYQETGAHDVLARIMLARGDEGAAQTAVRLAVEQAEGSDAQMRWPTLITFAHLARWSGSVDEGRTAIDELVDSIAETETVGDPQDWHVELVLELDTLDRGEDAAQVVARMPEGPWSRVCRAAAERDYAEAADLLASMGEQPLQARLRVLAARRLAAEGRLPDAEQQLNLARAFWESVGAVAYLREADEVLAA